ncbi:MAG: hypothetical protein HY902_14260 [Deltaproteobacteria bacterium]|nr:hypothetical protein [Deltaproteobacteria bacterium]
MLQPAAPRILASAWLDLCWHGLAQLPLPVGDAASLHDPVYIAWSGKHLRAELRTLPSDAAQLAAWVGQAAHGPWLQLWPALHVSVEDFAVQAGRPFREVRWADAQRQRLAIALQRALPEALIEVFRAALWSELRAGYLELRERQVLERLAGERHALAEDLAALGRHFAAVHLVDWQVSHPLRRHGRLLGGPTPTIAIGLPDPALAVPRYAPILQGWHELVLLHVQRAVAEAAPGDPRAGRPGHAAHQRVERLALTLGARLLDVPELLEPQRLWLQCVLRRVPAAQVADVRGWVAAGGLLDGASALELDARTAEVGAALRSAT